MLSELSETEARLLAYITSLNAEAYIANMYKVLKQEPKAEDTPRRMQQYVGAYVCKLNEKLTLYEIVPGQTKRTYKMVPRA